MNILKKLRKDSRGFGHIEMIVIVLVVAAIAASGFFVYQNHSKTGKHTTAHAGSWSTVAWFVAPGISSSTQNFTVQACYTPIQAFGTTINQVKVAIINNGHTGIGYFIIGDFSNNTQTYSQDTSKQWLNSSQSWLFFPVINMVPIHNDSVIINVPSSPTQTYNVPIYTDSHFGVPVYKPFVFNMGKTSEAAQTALSRC